MLSQCTYTKYGCSDDDGDYDDESTKFSINCRLFKRCQKSCQNVFVMVSRGSDN